MIATSLVGAHDCIIGKKETLLYTFCYDRQTEIAQSFYIDRKSDFVFNKLAYLLKFYYRSSAVIKKDCSKNKFILTLVHQIISIYM